MSWYDQAKSATTAAATLSPLNSVVGGAYYPIDFANGMINGSGGSKATFGSDMPTPMLNNYEGITRGNKLLAPYQLSGKIGGIGNQLDTSGISRLGSEAMADPGQSAWLKMANTQQGLEQKNLLGQASQQAATNAASAQANLAMHGGLRGGAAERLGRGSQQDMMLANQNILNQGAQNRAGLGLQAEQNRQNQLGQLVGAQQNQANYLTGIDTANMNRDVATHQFDINSMIGDQANVNEFNKYKFGQQMAGKASAMQAQAIQNSGGSGGSGNPISNIFGMFGGGR